MTLHVVIPVGPGEQPFFESALQSILIAEAVDQILIVLDGRDSMPQFTLDLSDTRVKVWKNPGRRGIGSAMNYGITQSTAEYVAVMHADDVSHPLRFKEQLRVMQDSSNFVALGTLATDPDDLDLNCCGNTSSVKAIKLSCTEISTRMPLNNPTTVFRRDDFNRVKGYRNSMTSMEDYELLLRLARIGSVGVLPLVLYGYRSHPNQQSRRHRAFHEWWWIFVARLGLAKSGQISYGSAIKAQALSMSHHLMLSARYRSTMLINRWGK